MSLENTLALILKIEHSHTYLLTQEFHFYVAKARAYVHIPRDNINKSTRQHHSHNQETGKSPQTGQRLNLLWNMLMAYYTEAKVNEPHLSIC